MRRLAIAVSTALIMVAPAHSETAVPAADAGNPPAAGGVTSVGASKSAAAAPSSTAESRSAAALALSHEPTFDEGTAQRIKDAALSYSDIAVRGGWPAIPADAKFALGVPGPNDELLRKRLIISGDLAADRPTGAFDEVLAEALKRFQVRHGLAATGKITPRTVAALNVSVHQRIRQFEASLERLEAISFGFGPR